MLGEALGAEILPTHSPDLGRRFRAQEQEGSRGAFFPYTEFSIRPAPCRKIAQTLVETHERAQMRQERRF